METDKIYNKATSWYVINLKARTNQCPQHYVNAIREINNQDPLIEVRGNKCISIHSMDECNISITFLLILSVYILYGIVIDIFNSGQTTLL